MLKAWQVANISNGGYRGVTKAFLHECCGGGIYSRRERNHQEPHVRNGARDPIHTIRDHTALSLRLYGRERTMGFFIATCARRGQFFDK